MTRDLLGKTEAHHSTGLQLVKSHSDERVVALSAVASGRLERSRVATTFKIHRSGWVLRTVASAIGSKTLHMTQSHRGGAAIESP